MSSAQDDASARANRGRQIYLRGTSPSGKEILTYIGDQSLEVPGASMPCASCHGLDGKGKPEGGINPSNITEEFLSKPYLSTQAYGRKHPPYTERGLELAITRGVDPAGNKLLAVMPRYAMSREDLADLIFYLARLGKDRDPGITENALVIGLVIPAKGPLAEMGQAVKAVVAAYFDEINNAGGIYNRRLQLKIAETGETTGATRKSIEEFLASEPVFALTSPFIAGAEKEVLPVFSEKEIPVVGPLTLKPGTTFPLNRQVFYLLSGIETQERVLAEFAAGKTEIKRAGLAMVYSGNNNGPLVDAIQQQAKKLGLPESQAITYISNRFEPAEIIKQIRQAKREAVFLLGTPEENMSFMREAESANWFPYIFLTSAGPQLLDAPPGFDGRVFIAFPTSPADQTAEGTREFSALASRHQLPTKHLAAQISSYSAAKVLVEGLKRTGKDLSREKLIQTLEELFEYRTGLTPAITYGPNRRIGATGSYVVTIDLKERKFVPASGWIGIN
jgi:ABC-type branched-subunit amino acid transport system substrate-binding protein